MSLEPQLETTVLIQIGFWDTLFVTHGSKKIYLLLFPFSHSFSVKGSLYFIVFLVPLDLILVVYLPLPQHPLPHPLLFPFSPTHSLTLT